jgi:hypothetical protein
VIVVGTRRVLLGLLTLAAIGVIGLGVQALRMHEDSGEWRLTNSPTPNRIHVGARDYDRADLAPVELPAGFVGRGETKGGGAIYVPDEARLGPDGEQVVPLIVYVRVDDADGVITYGLAGGP